MSGQTADFNAGGLFPYPVPQPGNGGTTITIQFQKYGVELKFTPVVLGDGRIRLNVVPMSASWIIRNAFVVDGYTVPGLTERKLDTTVELGDGQTLALAGLLQRQINATSNITPLLGDLPVLDSLFRSVNYQDNDTELVVLVTPHIAGPMNPGEAPDMPGEKWPSHGSRDVPQSRPGWPAAGYQERPAYAAGPVLRTLRIHASGNPRCWREHDHDGPLSAV